MSEAHRYKVVKMLSESGNKISYDPHGPEVVMASAYDESQSQLAALREELDKANGHHLAELMLRDRELEIAAEFHSDLQQRLADAERWIGELEADRARIDFWQKHPDYAGGFASSGDWSFFSRSSKTCYGKDLRAAMDQMQVMHAALNKPEEAKS